QKKLEAVMPKIQTPFRSKDYKATLTAIDEVVKDSPELADDLARYKLAALCYSGDVESGLDLGNKLLKKYNDDYENLFSKFSYVIDSTQAAKIDPRIAQMVLKAASRADELTKGEQPFILNMLAEAQFRTGDAAAAVATEQKCIDRLKAQYKELPESAFKP